MNRTGCIHSNVPEAARVTIAAARIAKKGTGNGATGFSSGNSSAAAGEHAEQSHGIRRVTDASAKATPLNAIQPAWE